MVLDCSYTRLVTSAAPRRLGILGGTFDPPHYGHLEAARAALAQVGLDAVVLMVANEPWQKTDGRHVTEAAIRLDMVKALVEGCTGISADDREIRRGGPTYTVDTLEEIHAESPGAEIFLIMGADTAERIHSWHRAPDVVRLSTIVIVNRDNSSTNNPEFLRDAQVVHVSMESIAVSSSGIRDVVAKGGSITNETSNNVAAIVRDNGLYAGQR
ncbi:MAG: nicotinate (nicotinamide) nucleotide adenylyltransferase [Actinobacteria bacterium]|nr:nicotinate (nicotinamide) nucleotide adenylyltransferase [Actinomycetota bacterium]MSZ60993.1 nicotinate (nicotinamide) nucleotide adenylyltransferase [Actinomycetota bacterium]